MYIQYILHTVHTQRRINTQRRIIRLIQLLWSGHWQSCCHLLTLPCFMHYFLSIWQILLSLKQSHFWLQQHLRLDQQIAWLGLLWSHGSLHHFFPSLDILGVLILPQICYLTYVAYVKNQGDDNSFGMVRLILIKQGENVGPQKSKSSNIAELPVAAESQEAAEFIGKEEDLQTCIGTLSSLSLPVS